jgi:hypothetical protein
MTSGIPVVKSRTFFLTQFAALSLEEWFVRAVEHTNGDQSIWTAIEQIIAPETLDLPHQGYEALSHTSSKFLPQPRLTLYFLMLVNMFPPSGSARGEAL